MSMPRKKVVRFDLWIYPVFDERLRAEPGVDLHVGATAGPPEREVARLEDAHVFHVSPAKDELPIRGYATMLGAFVGSFAGLALVARRSGRLPRRVSVSETVLLGVATHKLTRIVTRERVAIPLRVPFTRYQGRDGAGEVNEEPRPVPAHAS